MDLAKEPEFAKEICCGQLTAGPSKIPCKLPKLSTNWGSMRQQSTHWNEMERYLTPRPSLSPHRVSACYDSVCSWRSSAFTFSSSEPSCSSSGSARRMFYISILFV